MEIRCSSHQKQTLQAYQTMKVFDCTALCVCLFSLGQNTHLLRKCHTLCLLLNYWTTVLSTLDLQTLTYCVPMLCWKVSFISPLNDAEDDNGTAQLEEDSVDQNRAAEVQYTSICNTYLPMDFPSNTSTSVLNYNWTLNTFQWPSETCNKY